MKYMEEVQGTFCYLQIKNKTLCKLLGETVLKNYIFGDVLDMLFTSGDFSCYYMPALSESPCDFLVSLFEDLDGIGIGKCVDWGYYQLVRSGLSSADLNSFIQCRTVGALKKVADLVRNNRTAIQQDMENYKVFQLDLDYCEDEHCGEYKKSANDSVHCVDADELQDLAMEIATCMPYTIPSDDSLDEIIGDFACGFVD